MLEKQISLISRTPCSLGITWCKNLPDFIFTVFSLDTRQWKKRVDILKGETLIGILLCNITFKIGTLENAGSFRNVSWAFCFVKHPTFSGGKSMLNKVPFRYTSKIWVSVGISFTQIFLLVWIWYKITYFKLFSKNQCFFLAYL
jgi:hypothetical protein